MPTTPAGLSLAHADHGLAEAHLALIDSLLAEWDGSFTLQLIEMPAECPALMSALYGPAAGDEPVSEDEVEYVKRGDRPGPSRLANLPPRPCRFMVLIAGPSDDGPVIYTAYGSPVIAPREWWDPSMKPYEAIVANTFWAQHALATEPTNN